MAEPDPLSEVFTVLAAPIAGTIRSVEQFRKGVDEFLRGVENFNRTMENLNDTAERVNGLLEEVEEPLRAALPQVTRTVKAADEMMQVVAGPAMAVAPGLTQLAETLNNPAFQRVPLQLGQMTDLLGELSQRLAPLGQLAESAGGMFGGFRLPGFPSPGSSRPPATSDASAEDGDAVVPDPEPASATKKAAKKKTTASKKKATSSRSKKKTATAKRSND
ncbi:MAG: hypothetical protein AAGD33_14880 [Actinomycetota bacterium]